MLGCYAHGDVLHTSAADAVDVFAQISSRVNLRRLRLAGSRVGSQLLAEAAPAVHEMKSKQALDSFSPHANAVLSAARSPIPAFTSVWQTLPCASQPAMLASKAALVQTGASVGALVGATVGDSLGGAVIDREAVGDSVGVSVGASVAGSSVGASVGESVGGAVGESVGASVGAVGA